MWLDACDRCGNSQARGSEFRHGARVSGSPADDGRGVDGHAALDRAVRLEAGVRLESAARRSPSAGRRPLSFAARNLETAAAIFTCSSEVGGSVSGAGDRAAYAVAADNLTLGHTVIADGVKPPAVTPMWTSARPRGIWTSVPMRSRMRFACWLPAACRLRLEACSRRRLDASRSAGRQ
jgi:hypothetical protein